MKKTLIITLLALFGFVGMAQGYTVVSGDSMWQIAQDAGISLSTLIKLNPQIANPNLIYPGQVINTGEINNNFGSAPMRPSGIDISIRQSLVAGASRTGTTLNIDPIITVDGHRWAMADIGDIAFGKIDQGNSNEEIISWSGMTDNTTYYTLTGVNWGYDYTGNTTSISNYKRHNSGARFIITDDDHYLRYQYVNQYDGLMNTGYNPTSDLQVATVGFVENRNGYWESPTSTYTSLPTGVNNGEARITLDDSKVYVWDGSTWILAGSGGGAGTIYRDDIVVTSTAQMTYALSSGSWPDKKYLQVFRNGQLLVEGAGNDYTAPTTGATITLLEAPVVGEVITLRVESIDFYNANWTSVNDDLLPDVDATHDIGSSTSRFKDAYLSGNANIGGTLGITGTTTFTGNTLNAKDIVSLTASTTITGATLPVPVYVSSTGKVEICDADVTNTVEFIGFAINNVTDDQTVYIQKNGIIGGFTGLTIGSKYYVQDTVGTIGTSMGTFEIYVGTAISTTQLLIQRGEYQYIGSSSLAASTTVPALARMAVITFTINNDGTTANAISEITLLKKGKTSGVYEAMVMDAAYNYSHRKIHLASTWQTSLGYIDSYATTDNGTVVLTGTVYFYR